MSLMRFRQENHGVMCHIEQMFYAFHVNPEHRNFLRFLLFKNNDPRQEIIDYRMTVHIFGNGPSPAVTTFVMRKTAEEGEKVYGEKTKEFICNNFYVDDGLTSEPTEEEVIDLIRNAPACLETANLHLHKVAFKLSLSDGSLSSGRSGKGCEKSRLASRCFADTMRPGGAMEFRRRSSDIQCFSSCETTNT